LTEKAQKICGILRIFFFHLHHYTIFLPKVNPLFLFKIVEFFRKNIFVDFLDKKGGGKLPNLTNEILSLVNNGQFAPKKIVKYYFLVR